MAELWQARLRTLRSMMLLLKAKYLVAYRPFEKWHDSIGWQGMKPGRDEVELAEMWSGHVERAAMRLPIEAKCLPQAIALSWILRSHNVSHTVAIAARPDSARSVEDANHLHAWVAIDDSIVLGRLPGPWAVIVER